MSSTIFILGKDRELSLAELVSVYPAMKVQALGRGFVVIQAHDAFTQGSLNRLGGVPKAAQLLTSVNPGALNQALLEEIRQRYNDTKINYGLNLYDWPSGNLRQILSRLKKTLKSEGIKSRFANQDYQNISTAQSKGLRNGGVEFIVVRDADCLLFGEVVAVQDIDAYSKRDYEKPYRSMQVGMLPPKLSQILINLTGVSGSIWDPFCGGGGLLMEGLLMGHDMLGSDINKKALDGARQNIGWLQREFDVHQKADLFEHDAIRPLKGKKFDAIACEGYLGPPQERKLRMDQLQPMVDQLEKLYVNFFRALQDMKFCGVIVIAMPFFRVHEGKEIMLSGVIKKIKQFGFQPTKLLPESLTERDPYVLKYARSDQLVGRAIYRFMLG